MEENYKHLFWFKDHSDIEYSSFIDSVFIKMLKEE